jgi:hypothetical protein
MIDKRDLGRVAFRLYQEQPSDGFDNDVRAAQEALLLNLLPRLLDVDHAGGAVLTDAEAEAVFDSLPTDEVDEWRDEVREIVRDELDSVDG